MSLGKPHSFVVEAESLPIFLLQINPPSDLKLGSKRREADIRMRQLIKEHSDKISNRKIPVLYGVSAFGTKMAFYKIDRRTGFLEPLRGGFPQEESIFVPPQHWWDSDVLEVPGGHQFKNVVDEVKNMCTEH